MHASSAGMIAQTIVRATRLGLIGRSGRTSAIVTNAERSCAHPQTALHSMKVAGRIWMIPVAGQMRMTTGIQLTEFHGRAAMQSTAPISQLLKLGLAILGLTIIPSHVAKAATDFPLASCAGWDGTINEIEGKNTELALMRGTVTRVDLTEYCERDPGGETKKNGGRLSTSQCVAKYLAEEGSAQLTATADCKRGLLTFRYGSSQTRRAKFPLRPDADTSCSSGMPPMIRQFQILCPRNADRWNVDR